jgi:hypothetical protein
LGLSNKQKERGLLALWGMPSYPHPTSLSSQGTINRLKLLIASLYPTINQSLTKIIPKIPSKIACQTPKQHKPNKTNNICIAKELFSIR